MDHSRLWPCWSCFYYEEGYITIKISADTEVITHSRQRACQSHQLTPLARLWTAGGTHARKQKVNMQSARREAKKTQLTIRPPAVS